MLCRAAATHNEACVGLLLPRGADANTVHRDQNAPEDLSSQNPSDFPLITMLLEHGADPNLCMRREHKQGLLATAAARGHIDMVRRLLEPGADVNHRYHYPLCRAVIAGHLPVAKLLLERGGDPNYISSG